MKRKIPRTEHKNEAQIPLSVNYHFTRKCNYECKFCFHQAKTSYHLPIEEAKRGITMLVDSGMKKINFSGIEILIEAKKSLIFRKIKSLTIIYDTQLP